MSEYISPPSIEDSFRELDERISDIVIGPAPAWQTPVMEHGWLAFGAGFAPPNYMRDMVGIVHLRGLIKGGTSGLSVFILPVGFRIGATEQFTCNDGEGKIGLIEVRPNGEVIATGNNAAMRLSGITFLGER